jgi:cardiolipin synthase
VPRWLTVPNLFTLSRLVLTPLIVSDILNGRHTRALVVFLAAAWTDAIDGWLARATGTATPGGAYLDPIADKCLLSGIFLAMGAAGIAPWWFVAIVFGRDLYILVAALAMLALSKVRKFPPSRWGKLSTFVQIATAVGWMVHGVWPTEPLGAIASAMLRISAGLTIWSGVHYTFAGARELKTARTR